MTTCGAGQELAQEGTNTSDRLCQACLDGKFSVAGEVCANWSVCGELEQELTAPNATIDRVCECMASAVLAEMISLTD